MRKYISRKALNVLFLSLPFLFCCGFGFVAGVSFFCDVSPQTAAIIIASISFAGCLFGCIGGWLPLITLIITDNSGAGAGKAIWAYRNYSRFYANRELEQQKTEIKEIFLKLKQRTLKEEIESPVEEIEG